MKMKMKMKKGKEGEGEEEGGGEGEGEEEGEEEEEEEGDATGKKTTQTWSQKTLMLFREPLSRSQSVACAEVQARAFKALAGSAPAKKLAQL